MNYILQHLWGSFMGLEDGWECFGREMVFPEGGKVDVCSTSRSLFCCCRFHGKSFLLPSFIWQICRTLVGWQTLTNYAVFFSRWGGGGWERFRENTQHLNKKSTWAKRKQACYVRNSRRFTDRWPSPSLRPSLDKPWRCFPFWEGKTSPKPPWLWGSNPQFFHVFFYMCCIGWVCLDIEDAARLGEPTAISSDGVVTWRYD